MAIEKEKQRVRHLRSNVNGKFPTADGTISGASLVDYGEIAVNYAEGNEFLSILNSGNNLTQFKSWGATETAINDAVSALEEEILKNEEAVAGILNQIATSVGLDEEAKYNPSQSMVYAQSAESVADAIELIDSALSATDGNVTRLETELTNSNKVLGLSITEVTESVGLNGEMKYQPEEGAVHVAGATSVADAIDKLDKAISEAGGSDIVNVSELVNDAGYITIDDVPTKVSDLTNDEGFITIDDVPVYTEANGLMSAEEKAKVAKITLDGDGTKFLNDKGEYTELNTEVFIVPADGQLPEVGVENKIYMIPSTETGEQNIYEEYVYTNGAWELFGKFVNDVDLSDYALASELTEVQEAVSALEEEVLKNEEVVATAISQITESVGLNEDASYTPGADTVYVKGAVSLTDAIDKLDKAIGEAGGSDIVNVSELVNDAGYITSADVPTKVSQLTNDKYYVTEDVNFEIIDKASINFKNTSTSVTMNYNTIEQNDSVGFDVNLPLATTEKAGAMSATDKSVIDTIVVNGDGTKFLNNKGEYATVTMPTKVSDLTNDANYATSDDIAKYDSAINSMNFEASENQVNANLEFVSGAEDSLAIPLVTTAKAGVMSAADKVKLNSALQYYEAGEVDTMRIECTSISDPETGYSYALPHAIDEIKSSNDFTLMSEYMVNFDVAVMGGDEDTNLTFDIYDRMVEAWGKHQSIIFKYNDQYYRVLDYNINDGVDKWLCIYITADNNYPSTLTLNVNTGAQLENSYPYSFYSSNLGSVATIAQNGLMSAEDKIKLNNLTTQVSTMPSTSDVQTMINDAITTVLNTEL